MSNIENKLFGIKTLNSEFSTVGYILINFVLVIFAFGLILIQDSEKKLKIKYLQTKPKNTRSEVLQYKKEKKFSIIPIKVLFFLYR